MPVIHEEKGPHRSELAIWEIQESLEYFKGLLDLSSDDEVFLRDIHERRALEWAASRYLLKRMLGRAIPFECLYDNVGKPYIPDDPRHISLSHSHGMAAVALSDQPIGIDIQKEAEKIRKIHGKFISESEMNAIGDLTLSHMHLAWSAKEAMFKLHGKGELDFRKHLAINLPEEVEHYGRISGEINKAGQSIPCEIVYRFIHSYIWVYATPA